MKLQAVFWDYPQFLDEYFLREFLQSNKNNHAYLWVMNRFLEHGRVVDTFRFFGLKEISSNLQNLKLSKYSRTKWQRLLQIYGSA